MTRPGYGRSRRGVRANPYSAAMKPTRLAATLLVSAISALFGCGGGSEGEAPSPVPATAAEPGPGEPLTSFVANGEGGISTLNVGVDAAGDFTVAGTGYHLQTGGASGCTITSNPADTTISKCNVLADGKGFLLCANTLSPYYTAMMLQQSEAQAVTFWELAGRTLTGIACGDSGLRMTGATFEVWANGGAFEKAEYGSSTWGPGVMDQYERTTTCTPGMWCQRLVVYKVGVGPRTQYFLALLTQLDPGIPPRLVRLYFLQT